MGILGELGDSAGLEERSLRKGDVVVDQEVVLKRSGMVSEESCREHSFTFLLSPP